MHLWVNFFLILNVLCFQILYSATCSWQFSAVFYWHCLWFCRLYLCKCVCVCADNSLKFLFNEILKFEILCKSPICSSPSVLLDIFWFKFKAQVARSIQWSVGCEVVIVSTFCTLWKFHEEINFISCFTIWRPPSPSLFSFFLKVGIHDVELIFGTKIYEGTFYFISVTISPWAQYCVISQLHSNKLVMRYIRWQLLWSSLFLMMMSAL